MSVCFLFVFVFADVNINSKEKEKRKFYVECEDIIKEASDLLVNHMVVIAVVVDDLGFMFDTSTYMYI